MKNNQLPTVWYNATTAQLTKSRLDELLSDLHYSIMDFKEKGITFNSLDDIMNTTPESVRNQIQSDKEQYFRNMKFVPMSLKRQADKEFALMQSELIPLAESLSRTVSQIPIRWRLKDYDSVHAGDYCVEYEEREYQEYIKKVSSFPIPQEYNELYSAFVHFCNEWEKLQQKSMQLGFRELNEGDVRWLFDVKGYLSPDGKYFDTSATAKSAIITPEKMCTEIISSKFKIPE